jgi:nitroreductase
VKGGESGYKHRLANGQLEGTIFRNAPAVILAHDLKQNMAGHENCALALRNIETLAVAMGLGTCWVGLFTAAANRKPRKINPLLGLDNSRRVFGALMIGYPKHRSRMRIPRNAREVTYL